MKRHSALLILLVAAVASAQSFNPALWSGMKYRLIGPFRGGRVTAVTGVPSQPFTFYMGSTGGGVWKTTDAGHTWNNVSDGFFSVASMGALAVADSDPNVVYAGTGSSKIRSNVSVGHGMYKSTDAGHSWNNVSDGFFSVASMGALAVADSDPNVVYAGTGSSKIRSNVSVGHGMYKSTDAGKTWSFIGLRDAGQISTIRVDPSNPDLVYVAVLGNAFVPSKERGIYRSADGGKTWKNVLFVSDEVGGADLELQPGNSKTLFACMWHGQRKPWTIISGGHEGGIYKSTDGGDHWTKLAGGLPNQLFGRSNVGISDAAPNRIYALIEAKPGSGLWRSDDAGANWTQVNSQGAIITRPFYYDTLGVDPIHPDVVYVGDENWFKSTDGGKTFRREPTPHGDNHDIWINPKNSDYMIQSNDGGANVSLDGGKSWSTQMNQPTAEIYQVATDNQYPYLVYGAQQDNTTVIASSLAPADGQPFRIGPGCETGPIIPDWKNPEIVYGGCKGQFSRENMTTSDEERYWIGAESLYGNGGETLTYRFQRVSPMEVSPHDPAEVYYGSQYVHRTKDGGVTWTRLGGDLTAHPPGEPQQASGGPITRDATGEEMYSTLYAIRESPVQKGLIWVGSNDGLVSVSRNDGETWSNVTPHDLPPGGRVQNIEPSPHRAGTAYVAIYRYLLGDFAPYIYRTDDFGKSWKRLTDGKNGIAADEPTRVVREDPDRAGLLYAGTEFGMYVSFDNGGHWQKFQMNLPVTPVTDIKIAHKDLILSTQGRSFWILDDLTPLEQVSEKTASAPFLFAPKEAVRTTRAGGGGLNPSQVRYPQPGAMIDYYLPQAASEVKMEILDAAGKPVRTFSSEGEEERETGGGGDDEDGGFRQRGGPTKLDKTAGMHRFTWDFRYPGPWASARRPEGPNGPEAVPGKYSVKLTVGSWTSTQPLAVMEDPRITKDGVTEADLREQFEHNMRVRELVSDVNKAVARIRVAEKNTSGDQLTKLKAVADKLITPSIRYSQPALQTHITYLYSLTTATDQKIGRDAIERYEVLRKELDQRIAELNQILGASN